jgi:alpha-beta hydrolase superfamily lysophospholipase
VDAGPELEERTVIPTTGSRPRRLQVPVLVMGAERDGIFTVREVRRTARAYRTQAEIVPGMGHDMMLDRGWQQVAERIDAWIWKLPP